MPYINRIKQILLDANRPLSAKEIADRLNQKGLSKKNDNKPVDDKQVRRAIRKDESGLIDTIKKNPYTYGIRSSSQGLWVLKTVHEDDKASQTVDNYDDNLSEYYNYDNFVANSKQINGGDIAILIDKEKILGFARIDNVKATKGKKTVRRCPECPSTTIDKRKTKKPPYRCNKGHEFETPIEEIKEVTKYRANFKSFVSIGKLSNDLRQLRPFYSNGYNQNMSMQRLDHDALTLFENIEKKLIPRTYTHISLPPDQGYTKEDEEAYQANNEDEREVALRAIRLRRGQQNFRKKLLERYNSTCIITGCTIVDILEAAHIRPYKGKNDNHPSNGLLLRADIHTLFDLNLIAIEPETLTVHFHRMAQKEYKEYHNKKINLPSVGCRPDSGSLKYRFENLKSGWHSYK